MSERDVRHVESTLVKMRDEVGDLFSTDVGPAAGVPRVSNRTIRRSLRAKGYNFSQCHKKGQLSVEDLKKRLLFARRCARQPDEVWTRGISFYLDGTGWVLKVNPAKNTNNANPHLEKIGGGSSQREHCKREEGGCRRKDGTFHGGHCSWKRCDRVPPLWRDWWGKFSNMVREYFPDLFSNSANPTRQLFLQDGDPSQNSKRARETWESYGFSMFAIPPVWFEPYREPPDGEEDQERCHRHESWEGDICHSDHHKHHHLSQLSSQPPPSVNIHTFLKATGLLSLQPEILAKIIKYIYLHIKVLILEI